MIHRNKGKFLYHSEPLQQKKIPLSQWATVTKENSYVAVNHCNKKKSFVVSRRN